MRFLAIFSTLHHYFSLLLHIIIVGNDIYLFSCNSSVQSLSMYSCLLLVLLLINIGQLLLSRIRKARCYLTSLNQHIFFCWKITKIKYKMFCTFSWSWTLELTRLFNSFPSFSLANFCYNLVHSKWFFTVVTVTRNFALWRRLIARKLFRNTWFFVNITLITFSASMAENIGTAKTFLAVIQDNIFTRWHIILIKWT